MAKDSRPLPKLRMSWVSKRRCAVTAIGHVTPSQNEMRNLTARELRNTHRVSRQPRHRTDMQN